MTHLVTDLLGTLSRYPRAPQYWVAYSGGVDSHVLMKAMAELAASEGLAVGAVHVNHQLHPDAGQWAEHCQAQARALGLPCQQLQADGRAMSGESPEAAARVARYRVLSDWLGDGHVLVSAHHRDDQAETLLLQLLRGGGVRGLAGMPEHSRLGRGWLLRPLLSWSRAELEEFARLNGLCYIEDPSNLDTGLDRNFLRHRLMPVLQERWPSAARTLARSAANAADAAALLELVGDADRRSCRGHMPGSLQAGKVSRLPPARARNVIRTWLAALGLGMPPSVVLEQILDTVCQAAVDREPRVAWPGGEIRRYRGELFAMRQLPRHDPGQRFRWRGTEPLELEAAGGRLHAGMKPGRGLRVPADGEIMEVRFRRGGECIRPTGRRHHHMLKKLFQERGIPPWERDRIPLVYIDDRLAAVAGQWVDGTFRARRGRAGLLLRWSRWPPPGDPRGQAAI